MTFAVVVGAQWGDEGKGKPVEILAPSAALCVQYAGGSNPGQAIVVGGERMVMHLVPSAQLRAGRTCLFAQGMAIDPGMLLSELDALASVGGYDGKLLIDQRTHVVLPHHVEIDRLRNELEGASGVPRRGIGPAYADKVARHGVQMGDLLVPNRLRDKVKASLDSAAPVLRALGADLTDPSPIVERHLEYGEKLRASLVDGSALVRKTLAGGAHVLAEAPFGTTVDIDHG